MTRRGKLPPMGPIFRRFAIAMFFLLGVVLAGFIFGNPLQLGFLPNYRGDGPPGGSATATLPMHICPMHPQVVQEGPGSCPICGMDLVPVTSVQDSQGTESDRAIFIDSAQAQRVGVTSEPARRETVGRNLRTLGVLDFNADRISWINTKFSGWIENVHVSYVGQTVEMGEPLFDIYSPELVSTQEEYLRALEYQRSLQTGRNADVRRQAASLLRSSGDRLRYWDVSEEQIRQLRDRGEVQRLMTVRSPVGGVITEVMDQALEGIFVNAGHNLYRIADLTSIWVHADIHEADLGWIEEGQSASVAFSHRPGRTARGTVLFLYPELSAETRTLKTCVEVDNPDGSLRAGMYAEVTIEGPSIRDAVTITDTAILRSGQRDVVFVDLGDGHFEPRDVQIGVRGENGRTQIVR
ncbi:MAG: efflux RND transporter periplasmic adaptor subunit, partial [Acidobacteriota bacterium]|nr:efflux RND transporter periplasmic adaptor subunit [Acidobacteriota bacterium]